ncbi:polyprenyl synthetase family protein [Kitasatospora purpeofusca]|uniref:polyprenyl synthetase family protein n=1 Tax=Kitasatospora purpeofusca TaxID=67352 RepID=UPI0038600B93
MAFQLVDDLLGIWGDPAVTGKPVFNDLRRRKLSVPVVAALESGTADGDRLAEEYRRAGRRWTGGSGRAGAAGGAGRWSSCTSAGAASIQAVLVGAFSTRSAACTSPRPRKP